MTDADVSFDGECDGQPDRRVAARVAQPHDVDVVAGVPVARCHSGVLVAEDEDEDERKVEDVVDGQRRQVVVGGGLHRPTSQHGDVDHVSDDPERNHDRHQHALDDEPRRRQLAGQSQRAVVRRSLVQRRRRRRHGRRRLDRHRADVGFAADSTPTVPFVARAELWELTSVTQFRRHLCRRK